MFAIVTVSGLRRQLTVTVMSASVIGWPGVAVAPGLDFDPVDGHRWIRFSCASATSDVQEALRRLGSWLGR